MTVIAAEFVGRRLRRRAVATQARRAGRDRRLALPRLGGVEKPLHRFVEAERRTEASQPQKLPVPEARADLGQEACAGPRQVAGPRLAGCNERLERVGKLIPRQRSRCRSRRSYPRRSPRAAAAPRGGRPPARRPRASRRYPSASRRGHARSRLGPGPPRSAAARRRRSRRTRQGRQRGSGRDPPRRPRRAPARRRSEAPAGRCARSPRVGGGSVRTSPAPAMPRVRCWWQGSERHAPPLGTAPRAPRPDPAGGHASSN